MDWSLSILAVAIILDMLIGDPDWLWRRMPHPVVYFGHMIIFFEKWLNDPNLDPELDKGTTKLFGILNCLILVGFAATFGQLLASLFDDLSWWGMALEAVIAAIFIAQKSMSDHVNHIIEPLKRGDLEAARKSLSMIVGRKTDHLDETGVTRAAIESLAENFSDGTVAPIFWYMVLGLPGLLAYKMLNTLDSMIGHKTQRYQEFGWASAKLDDLANWIPARLSALIIAMAASLISGGTTFQRAINTALRDARKHRSPNAGWPEAAMAGALNIALAGPRLYATGLVDDLYINEPGRKALIVGDLIYAKKLFWMACAVELIVIALLAAIAYLSVF